jgi:hypothetical protein
VPTTQAATSTATKTGGAANTTRLPATGTGSSTPYTPWLIGIGALLVVIGGSSVLAGARRRS